MSQDSHGRTRSGAAKGDSLGAPRGRAGAPPSNTAPCNCKEEPSVRLLRSGVDTLQLSFRGELFDEQAVRLRQLKELSQSRHLREQNRAQVELDGRLFQVHGKGFGLFKYVLTDHWYRISLSDGLGSVPVAFVQLASEPLTQYGVPSVETTLRRVLSKLCAVSDGPFISRIDICVDFATVFDFESVPRQHWLSRGKKYSSHAENGQFTGITIGLGGNVAFRLYDKTQEIRVSQKLWFEDLWLDCGWDGVTPVWRAEFEVKRDALAQFAATKLDDTNVLCARLWPYLTGNWVRLATPSDTDKTRSRWQPHPVWQAIQATDFGALNVPGLQRIERAGPPSEEYQLKRAGLSIIHFMALNGISDFSEGVREFEARYLGLLDHTSVFRGSSTEEYIEAKMGQFVRKHNLRLNERRDFEIDPVDAAIERAFRRGKDGE